MGRIVLLAAAALMIVGGARAQALPDTLMEGELDPIVVTGTRTPHELVDVPIPTSVLTRRDIEARGAVRLPDLLAEQAGLMLQYDHGTGIQMQGLGPEYTTVLIDGVKLVGRTAGTLDLDRITLNDVERIEIIRGPSSSLYGSDAMAGIVHVITAQPDSALEATLRSRYGTHATSDVSAFVGRRRGRHAASLSVDRYASAGYDLDPASIAPTGPAFTDYTVQSRLQVRPAGGTTLNLSGRANLQRQDNPILVDLEDAALEMRDRVRQLDWSLAPSLNQRIGESYLFSGRAVVSRFTNMNETEPSGSGEAHHRAEYAQLYSEGEAVFEGYPHPRHHAMAGAGFIHETVDADRVDGARRTFFAFAQDEWTPSSFLDVVVSARFDAPTDYAARLSPKAAALLRPADAWRLRLSVGAGYKAPAFRQLYLDFTNPTAGYSVLGAAEVPAGLERLDREGQLSEILVSGLSGDLLEAESSLAYNVEVAFQPSRRLRARLGLFRNDVHNLIDTRPIAVKHNGQHVFTYFNVSEVYTRGVEAEAYVQLLEPLSVRIGYQLLDTGDREVLDRIDAGELYTRVNGRDRPMARSDYGGLMQRSRHQGSVQLLYAIRRADATIMLSSRLRGRYGFADVNGNAVLDAESEYAPGYAVWNLAASKRFSRVTLRAGVDNLRNARPDHVPALSGARWYGALELEL